MAGDVSYDAVEPGLVLPGLSVAVQRLNLVMYAGASEDFNPIHWNDQFAASVGLPGVIAHGLLTMAEAGRVVTDWVGDPGAVVEYGVRFRSPVAVPNDDKGAELELGGQVAEKLGEGRVRLELTARSGGQDVLSDAYVVVRLA